MSDAKNIPLIKKKKVEKNCSNVGESYQVEVEKKEKI